MPVVGDPLGHAGLTVAAVFAVEFVIRRVLARSAPQEAQSPEGIPSLRSQSRSGQARRCTIDYRLVIIGSLLPDLIDKSVGQWLLPEIFSHADRSFAHTLLFNSGLMVFLFFCSLFSLVRPFGFLIGFCRAPGA